MGTIDLNSFKRKFIDEAHTLLSNLDNCLIELEKQPDNTHSINEAFRIMHTIKGTSGMYGFEKMVETTHEMESLYSVVRDNQLVVSQALLDLTFLAVDHIRALLYDEECKNETNKLAHNKIMMSIEQMRQNGAEDVQYQQPKQMPKIGCQISWNILFYPDEQLVKRAINLVYVFQDLFALGNWKIYKQPFSSKTSQYWSIFLVTDKPYEEIEDALLFVMDYCKITKVADYNIFDPKEIDKWIQSVENMTAITDLNELVSTVNNAKLPQVTVISTSLEKETATPVLRSHATNHINVSAAKLDTLMYLVSELVTAKSELMIALKQQNLTKAMDTAEKIEKLTKQFSDNALNIRLVSLHEMLNGFKRLVRDLSKQLGKSIRFETVGDDTELDKNIIDNIGEPIMHLIRNCIDHGIENADKRRERGKNEEGTVRFEAMKLGNYVYITIGDDGNGIDTEYVYRKAIDKGFIAQGTVLSQKEIHELIFLPGFSTAESLTNVSGRGVGMDVVKRKIQEIRGEIAIQSQVGVGTTFTLKLQQSISIIETLLVESAGTIYAIPIEDVEACILEPLQSFEQMSSFQLTYNQTLVPYINLCEKFGNSSRKGMPEAEKVVIVKRLDKTYAMVVDHIIGEYQAVIKPLGDAFANIGFLSGASLLGDGSIALLIDTDQLWHQISNIHS
jgi:two-component system, chemotaxis family, sensor kinase CheA